MKTSRDNSGKLRIAKGDKTGLGGQYAPDVQKLDTAKQQLEGLTEELTTPTVNNVRYEIWCDTFDYDGILSYAPVFDNEREAKKWAIEFANDREPADEIKSIEVVAVSVDEFGDKQYNSVSEYRNFVNQKTKEEELGYVRDELGVVRDENGYCVECAYEYCECDPGTPDDVDENCTMSVDTMVALIRKEWSDAMSDDGRIWSKTFNELQTAKQNCPKLFEKALPIAKKKGRGF